ncbi:MAG: protein jag, partial [Atribacterota bacterium]|nr:protein jag [Atribacterota bacterium]
MKRSVEVSGKSLEEALERASRYFDVPKEHLNYEVLSENKGFLGILVPKVVKVRVWVDDQEEEAPVAVASAEETPKVSAPSKAPQEKIPLNLEELQRVATGFLQGLLDKMQVNVEVVTHQEEGSVVCVIDGKDAGILIGRKGETLEAMEVLLRTFLSKKGFETGYVELDIANYKKRREEALRKLAEKVAQKVIREKRRVKLEPMNARERRIIHTTLKEHPQVVTYSVGFEPTRRVVVELKNAGEEKERDSGKKGGRNLSKAPGTEKRGRNSR